MGPPRLAGGQTRQRQQEEARQGQAQSQAKSTAAAMKGGLIRKRSVRIAGHATSVSLEETFWRALADLARAQGISVNALITRIDRRRGAGGGNLSSAIRVHVLENVRRG